jgi:DNA polymerase I-like protein with 3'-5' exonuclease and polymerase domains
MKEWSKNKPKKGASHWEWNDWKNNKPEERAIPQVRIDGKEGKELCESVSELAEQVPEISYLEEYSVIKHRLDTLKGILTRVDDCGKVEASFGGLTNSLRCKHRSPIVNLPAANRKYAEPIRGSLVAPKSSTLLGSDLKSVEDRIKHSMMLPYDADYVNKMLSDNYDPHLETAIAAGLITEEDAQAYKDGSLAGEDLVRVTLARHKGKTINYSSVYGIGADKLARSLGVSVEEAKIGLEGYWELNSSVKSIAADQVVVKDRLSREWLINPINGLLYSVRGEKDYFSTLIQGSGSYLFDMWLKGILKRQWDLWGKVTLTAQVHDEFVLCFKDLAYFREVFSEMINSSLGDVNKEYMLRRELGCSIAFGSKYSEIH